MFKHGSAAVLLHVLKFGCLVFKADSFCLFLLSLETRRQIGLFSWLVFICSC